MFERFDDAFLAEHLLPARDFMLYPPYEDRAAWAALEEPVKEEMVRRGEAWLEYPWPSLLATRYMDFMRTGNRSRYERDYFDRRTAVIDLMIAECVEGQGRFLDALVNGAWLICEETSWTLPAHGSHDGFVPDPLPDGADSPRDLFACETGALMAVLYGVMGRRLDEMSRRLPLRIREETLRRIVRPACRSYSFWMGIDFEGPLNNWAAWCASTSLAAVLLLGETEGVRRQYARQMLTTMERFAGIYGDDGGCDEGPAYWSRAAATFFDALTLLHRATGGALDVFQDPKVQAMGLYLPRMYISGNWFVDFADCAASLTPAADLVYRYGSAVGAADMMDFGAHLACLSPERAFSHTYSVLSAMEQLWAYGPMMAHGGSFSPHALDFFPDIEVLVARRNGLTLAAKGGHNAESHNHNDVASFILYREGEPAVIDAGTLTYSRKTFSPQRYEIWTMGSSFHTLPDFGGQAQAPGAQYRSGGVTATQMEDGVRFAIEAAGAWEAGVRRYRRELTLSDSGLTCWDCYELDAPQTATFHFLLAEEPRPVDGGWRIGCRGGDLLLAMEGARPSASTVDVIYPEDETMNRAWGRNRLYRLNITLPVNKTGNVTWRLKPLGGR